MNEVYRLLTITQCINKVAPAYLEDMLTKHPDVADSAVIGIPDVEAGELPKAFVVRQPNTNVTEEEICKYIEGRLKPTILC